MTEEAEYEPTEAEILEDLEIQRILFTTKDPSTHLDGSPVICLTLLLYRVCQDDLPRFMEATRLIELYIKRALEVGKEIQTRTDELTKETNVQPE